MSVRWSCHTYDLDMSGHGHSARRCPDVYAWTFLSATQRLMLAGLWWSSTSYVVCVVGFWTFVVVMMLKVNKTVQNASRMGRGREESPDALNIGANHVARVCPYVYGVISVVDAFITVQLPHTAHPTRRDSDFPHRCFHVLCLHYSSCFGDNHGHFVQGIRKWSTDVHKLLTIWFTMKICSVGIRVRLGLISGRRRLGIPVLSRLLGPHTSKTLE